MMGLKTAIQQFCLQTMFSANKAANKNANRNYCILLYFQIIMKIPSVCMIFPPYTNSANKRDTKEQSFSCNFVELLLLCII